MTQDEFFAAQQADEDEHGGGAMKWILAGLGIIVAGAVAYATVSKLSADAIGMALGMTLGVLAGVPTAALVLLARRRDDTDDNDYRPIYVPVLPMPTQQS
jgi:hypothetical protein